MSEHLALGKNIQHVYAANTAHGFTDVTWPVAFPRTPNVFSGERLTGNSTVRLGFKDVTRFGCRLHFSGPPAMVEGADVLAIDFGGS